MNTASKKHNHAGGKITTICATLVFILSIIVLIAPSDSFDASMTVGTTKDVQWISESEQTLYDTSGTAIAEIRIVHDDEGTQRIDVRNAVDWWDQLMMRIVNQPHDPNTTHGYFGQSPSYYEYSFYTTWGMQPQPTSGTIMYQFYMSDDSPTEPASDSQIVTFEFIVGEKPVYNYTTSVSYDIGEYATGDFGPDSVSESLFEQSTKILEFTVPLDVPQRTDGWVFDYWQGSDGLTYEPGAKIRATIGDDLDLTAKWIRPMVTVTFWNGDEVYIDMSVETGTTVTSPDDPRVDGMFFTGWYTDDGTFQDLFDFDTIIETDMDLYAGWEDELHFTTEPAADGTVVQVDGVENTYLFQVTPGDGVATVLWDFGDGTISTQRAVAHYFEPGQYTVTLTVYNSSGDSDSTQFMIDTEDEGRFQTSYIIAIVLLTVVLATIVVWRFLL